MKIGKVDLYNYFNIQRPQNGAGYLNEYIIERYEFESYLSFRYRNSGKFSSDFI